MDKWDRKIMVTELTGFTKKRTKMKHDHQRLPAPNEEMGFSRGDNHAMRKAIYTEKEERRKEKRGKVRC